LQRKRGGRINRFPCRTVLPWVGTEREVKNWKSKGGYRTPNTELGQNN